MLRTLTHSQKVAAGLTALLALLLFFSAGFKLMHSQAALDMMASHGLAGWLDVIAAGEILSTLAFLVPATRPAGSLLLSSYFGGAIMFHMSHGESFLVPAGVLLTVWLATYLWGDWKRAAVPGQ